jgi:hypothetical protein
MFLDHLRRDAHADLLRDAALRGQLGDWTRALTTLVVETCATMGWTAAALGRQPDQLPVPRSEYLALDVMAFAQDAAGRWRFPAAVMELENRSEIDFIAYSLWKLLCVRAELRVLYCYRRQPEEGRLLVQALTDQVVGAMPIEQRTRLDGETLIVVGSRGEAATFPYGFFRWWRLDKNTGRFVVLTCDEKRD